MSIQIKVRSSDSNDLMFKFVYTHHHSSKDPRNDKKWRDQIAPLFEAEKKGGREEPSYSTRLSDNTTHSQWHNHLPIISSSNARYLDRVPFGSSGHGRRRNCFLIHTSSLHIQMNIGLQTLHANDSTRPGSTWQPAYGLIFQ